MIDGDFVRLPIRLQPRAPRDQVVGLDANGALRVKVSAAPVDGAANERLVALVARRLRLPKANVTIRLGASSRSKVLEIRGSGIGLPELIRKLTEEI